MCAAPLERLAVQAQAQTVERGFHAAVVYLVQIFFAVIQREIGLAPIARIRAFVAHRSQIGFLIVKFGFHQAQIAGGRKFVIQMQIAAVVDVVCLAPTAFLQIVRQLVHAVVPLLPVKRHAHTLVIGQLPIKFAQKAVVFVSGRVGNAARAADGIFAFA